MIRVVVGIGFEAVVGALTAAFWLLWAAGWQFSELRYIWPEFRAEWSSWSQARQVVRTSLVLGFYLGVVTFFTLASWLINLHRARKQVIGFALLSAIWYAAIIISGPFARQRRKTSGGL